MGRDNVSDDGDGGGRRGCFAFLALWFPGLRRPDDRRSAQSSTSYSTGSSESTESKDSSYNMSDDTDEESPSFDEQDSSSSSVQSLSVGSGQTARSSSAGSWSSIGDIPSSDTSNSDSQSTESDPEERARRAAESFLRWKDKEYVPLSSEEKRAIKEYRKSVANEEGTYMSTRAQRPRPGDAKRRASREDECVQLSSPADGGGLVRRRSSKIRFTAAVVAHRAANPHNEEVVVVVTEAGEEVPALPRSASILQRSSITEEPPVFVEDLEGSHAEEDVAEWDSHRW
ncbi:hypothetical protein NESM_000704100 [Novymonas esmeraldas]|uniref:Uncharacterized protein n=1 Tax=Novymonas esmeraldas TaxID=1808958 RepID=A0AAW0EVI4_9TRYP